MPEASDSNFKDSDGAKRNRDAIVMIGQIVSHYKIIEKLGAGGMGIVYKAEDTKLKRTVALKFLPPELTRDEEAKKRFIHEAQAASTLEHTNICNIHEINETGDGQLFIVMACYDGQSLRDRIAGGNVGASRPGATVPLPIDDAINITLQIARGLQKAHAAGIVHRDIKPANIMITSDDVVKILDFGLAKLSGQTRLTRDGSTPGTVAYMSPEQLSGKEIDQRSDIWSLGIVLYEMVSGQLPFSGEYEQSVIYSILNDQPPPLQEQLPAIPSELLHIINRALEKDKNDRYQSIDDLLIDLKRLKRDSDKVSDIPSKTINHQTHKEKSEKSGLRSLVIPLGFIILFGLIYLLLKYDLPFFDEETDIDPKPIAVLPFENLTGNTDYDIFQKSIANLFIAKLEQSQYLRVTTWERMRDLLKQMGKDNTEIVEMNKEDGFELCKLDGVTAAVTGSYSKIGNTYALEVKVLDVQSKNILVSETANGEGENSIFGQIDDLSQAISKGIGLSQDIFEQDQRPIADVTTRSMEAYNYFIRGNAENEKLYYNDALVLLKKAVELDSTFALAYIALAGTYTQLGYINARTLAYEKAKKFSYKATHKEKLYIDASYAGAIEKDQEKRIRIYKELAQKYPKERPAHYILGRYYRSQRQYKEAIREFEILIDLNPDHGMSLNQLGYIYSEMEDYETAMVYYKKYALAAPGEANPFDSMAELYFKMGKIDQAIANYKKTLTIRPGFYDACWRLAYVYAFKEEYDTTFQWIDQYYQVAPSESEKAISNLWKGFYYYWLGQMENAISELNKTEGLVEDIGNQRLIFFSEWIKGLVHISKGDYGDTRIDLRNWFDSVLNLFPQDEYMELYYNLEIGILYLNVGRVDSAEQKLKKINELQNKSGSTPGADISRYIDLLHGEILLADGQYERAIGICDNLPDLGLPSMWTREVMSYNLPLFNDLKARAYDLKGDADRAIIEYEQLTAFDPNDKNRRLIHPSYYYHLAKLYEKKGESSKAIKTYEKFLSLWKSADEDLPELIEARARLNKLIREK